MELQEFLDCMNAGKRVIDGSGVHQFMSAASFEVMELTCKLSACHGLGEIQELFAQITGKPVNRTFALFPPFAAMRKPAFPDHFLHLPQCLVDLRAFHSSAFIFSDGFSSGTRSRMVNTLK